MTFGDLFDSLVAKFTSCWMYPFCLPTRRRTSPEDEEMRNTETSSSSPQLKKIRKKNNQRPPKNENIAITVAQQRLMKMMDDDPTLWFRTHPNVQYGSSSFGGPSGSNYEAEEQSLLFCGRHSTWKKHRTEYQ